MLCNESQGSVTNRARREHPSEPPMNPNEERTYARAARYWFASVPILLLTLFQKLSLFGAVRDIYGSSSRRLAEAGPSPWNLPLEHVSVDQDSFFSTVHCVGENYGTDAWKYRSCQFRNICFDTSAHEYVLFPSKEEIELHRLLQLRQQDGFVSVSTSMQDKSVSLGTLSQAWSTSEQSTIRWFPRIETDRTKLLELGVYMIPSDKVLVPFHSFQAKDAGHLIIDDWFPIYLVASIFGLEQKQLLLVRHTLRQPLPGTCDENSLNYQACQKNFDKYAPLMSREPNKLILQSEELAQVASSKSHFVCSKYAAAGLGLVANHMVKDSDFKTDDYKLTHMVGYGTLLWQYRSFIMDNLFPSGHNLPLKVLLNELTVTFDVSTATSELAQLDDIIRQQVSSTNVLTIRFEELELKKAASIVSRSAILVVDCRQGEGLALSLLLPRHASLVIYCPDESNVTKSMQLDWDMFNHGGYFRTYWLSRPDLESKLLQVIRAEIELLNLEQEIKKLNNEL